jgi:PRTRC genetic system ThiF family protein
MNLFWGLEWDAVLEHLSSKSRLEEAQIVIGCVDSAAARGVIRDWTSGNDSRVHYWLDLGNKSDGGQFVLGEPLNGRNRRCAERLRTVSELFPEVVDIQMVDDEPSCSAAEALKRQEPFVNPTLANHALALLARLFRYGRFVPGGIC